MSTARWRRFGGSVATIAVLSLGLAVGSTEVGSTQRASASTSPTVELNVDYTAKTITVTAHIDFYQTNGVLPEDTIVRDIVKAITDAWNGHKFKCFAVVVKVDAKIVANKSKVRSNAVDIKLENSRVNAFSHLGGSGTANYLSDAPGDRVDADPASPSPTTWGKYTDPSVWPHEFGHILGLHDNYDEKDNSILLDGAQRDMMFSQGLPVSAEMITRMIRRNNKGELDESKVKCPISMDAGPSSVNAILIEIHDLGMHAYTCDYDAPSDDPDPKYKPKPIAWKGDAHGAGSYDLQAFGKYSGSFSGPISFSAEPNVKYHFSLSSPTGSIEFGGTYRWDANGLPIHLGSMTLFGYPSSTVGLGLYPVFTEGASECPP